MSDRLVSNRPGSNPQVADKPVANRSVPGSPPGWAIRLLRWYCSDRFIDELEGDLMELYDRHHAEFGARKASRKFALGVLGSFRFYRMKKTQGLKLNIMLVNHLKVAFRHSLRHRVFSAVNLVGLFFGLAAAFYIGIYVKNELSYDSFHEKKGDLYRVLRTNPLHNRAGAGMSSRYGAMLHTEFPEMKICRMGEDPVKIGETNPILIEDFFWTDSTFFDLFSFKLLHGNPNTALADPAGLVITSSLSQKLFGKENPVGEVVKVKIYDGDKELQMKITGVVADPPRHSHIQFSALGTMAIAESLYGNLLNQWGFSWVKTYALMPGLENSGIAESIPSIIEKHIGKEMVAEMGVGFQPFGEVYLYSQHLEGNKLEGNIENVVTFSTIGAFILLIAIFNYINLSTARALSRAKEIGLRKTIGAGKRQLVGQFLAESVFYTVVAAFMAVGLVSLLLPLLNVWLQTDVAVTVLNLTDWLLVVAVVIVLGVLAGLYPAFVMARYAPGQALSKRSPRRGANTPRKVLIVLQYGITIFLITGSVVVFLQFRFLKNYDLGFKQEQLINIAVDDRGLQSRIDILKSTFADISGVEKVAVSGEPLPARMQNTWSLNWPGSPYKDGINIDIVGVDQDYFDVLGLPLVAGGNFTLQYAADSSRSVIVNETALAQTENAPLLDEYVTIGETKRKVIGVVKDHHYSSLRSPIRPVAYMITHPGIRISPDNLLLKINTTDLPVLLDKFEATWKQFSSDPLKLTFVDEAFAMTYASEQKFVRIVSSFTAVAIVIALCGVFGLITFLAESRQKEIGVRKVLGATSAQLTLLLSSGFARLFVLALAITGPLAYYFANQWLAGYYLHINFSFQVIVMAAGGCFFISAVVVLWQAFKISRINPAKTLKAES